LSPLLVIVRHLGYSAEDKGRTESRNISQSVALTRAV